MYKDLCFMSCVCAILITACGERFEPVEQILQEGKEVRKFKIDQRGQRQGDFSRIVNDKLVETAVYNNDTLHGARQLYDSLGNVQVLEHYVNGKFHGIYRTFHTNGTVHLEGTYQNNMMQDHWRTYDSLGRLVEEVRMERNMENGPFREYYPDGTLKTEGYYKDGAYEHDTLKMYDASGRLDRIMFCREGFCNTIWESSDVEE